MKNKDIINFLGIGTEKSGTSWIADCLMEHSEIYLPAEKELFFFNAFDPHFLSVANLKYDSLGFSWYKKYFKSSKNKCKGEFTPTYIYCEKAAQRISKDFPNIKLIVILRDPTKRAFSQYIHDIKIGVIKKMSFEEALQKYPNYKEKGRYAKYLKMYLSYFPRKNFFITTFEEMVKNPKELMTQIYSFLELTNTAFVAKNTFKKSNQAASVRFSFLNYLMMQSDYFLRKNNLSFILNFLENLGIRKLAIALREKNTKPLSSYPLLKKETGENLKNFFCKDIESLEKLLNKDFSSWKN